MSLSELGCAAFIAPDLGLSRSPARKEDVILATPHLRRRLLLLRAAERLENIQLFLHGVPPTVSPKMPHVMRRM